ncbi:MAG: hypothetical protein AAGA25_01050 [Planctomycetota bacterium]
MTPAQQQLLARGLALVIVIAGGFAAWKVWHGAQSGAVGAESSSGTNATQVVLTPTVTALSADQLERLDTLRLQGGEAPPPPTGPVSLPPIEVRSIKLLGTLIPSQGEPEGLFIDGRDRLVVAKPGEALPGGARVESVVDGEARLSVNGRSIQLQTERKRIEAQSGGR